MFILKVLNLITYTKYSKFVAVSQLNCFLKKNKIKTSERPPSGQHLKLLLGNNWRQKHFQRQILTISDTPLICVSIQNSLCLGYWSCCSWDRVEYETQVKQQHGFKILLLAFTCWASILLVVFPLLPSDGSFINQSSQSTSLNTHRENPEVHYCLATVKGCSNTSQNCICLRTAMKSLNWMAQDCKAEESIGLLTSDKDSVPCLHKDHTPCW